MGFRLLVEPIHNLRRFLLRLDGLNLKSKLLLLLTWHTGPEIRSTAMRMNPTNGTSGAMR